MALDISWPGMGKEEVILGRRTLGGTAKEVRLISPRGSDVKEAADSINRT
jgi:hypothetical protein